MAAHHGSTWRRGFFRWLADLFRPWRGMGMPIDYVVSEYRTGEPIEMPAEGGVYHFTVSYDLTWSARGMSRSTLISWIDSYQESAERTLRNAIWPVARGHLPSKPAAAEEAMNEALRDGWCFGEAGEVVACAATVRVVADERVLDRHLPLWERFVEYDLHYRVEHERIDHLVTLLTRWRDILREFGADPLVIQAASSPTRSWPRRSRGSPFGGTRSATTSSACSRRPATPDRQCTPAPPR